MNPSPLETPSTEAPAKTRGEKYEGIAFTFCKAATILLLTLPLRRFALPVVALFAAGFFVLAHFNGQHTSRCILRKPLWIAAFWSGVALVSLWLHA